MSFRNCRFSNSVAHSLIAHRPESTNAETGSTADKYGLSPLTICSFDYTQIAALLQSRATHDPLPDATRNIFDFTRHYGRCISLSDINRLRNYTLVGERR